MPNTRNPRRGSLQYWPRKRSKRVYARVRSWSVLKEIKPLGFAGYKVGMSHIVLQDTRKASTTKGMDIAMPVTLIECPPIKVYAARFYKHTAYGSSIVSDILADSVDKEMERKHNVPKKKEQKEMPKGFDFVHLIVYTQPKLTGIGKKKPEMFEIALSGDKDEQLHYAQSKLGKEITIKEVFKEGQQVDMHGVTKGKGFQGPVKRFGVTLRSHKSEKSRRFPGSLGGWKAQGHIMWRVAKAGKMGYHPRTEYNKWIVKIADGKENNQKGGFMHYGVMKNDFVMVKGSVSGPQKRIVRFNAPMRSSKKYPDTVPALKYVDIQKE